MGANLCLLAVLAGALFVSFGSGFVSPIEWSTSNKEVTAKAGAGKGSGNQQRFWEDKYLESKLKELNAKEGRERRRLGEAKREVKQEAAQATQGRGRRQTEVRELQGKVEELEKKVRRHPLHKDTGYRFGSLTKCGSLPIVVSLTFCGAGSRRAP